MIGSIIFSLLNSLFFTPQYMPSGAHFPVSGGGGGSATLVQTQTVNGSTGGGASVSVTTTSTGAGHLLVAFGLNIQSATAVTIIDNQSETWTAAFSSTGCNTTQFGTAGCMFAYVCNSVSGVTSVSATGAGFASMTLVFREYSGLQTTSCLDQQSSLAGQAPGATITSNSVTTTGNDLLIGISTGGTPMVYTAGSGWSNLTSVVDTSATQLDVAIENKLSSTAGSNSASFGSSGVNGAGVGIVAFKI